MNRSKPRVRILPLLPLLALVSGGSPSSRPSQATALHYVNPPAASGHYQLVVEPASNDSPHLLLDLAGPSGTVIQGVAFFATAGPGAAWGDPGGATANAKAGPALTLGTPALFQSKLDAGGNLQVGIFQTQMSSSWPAWPAVAAATLGSAPIVTLALDLGQAGSGTAVSLAGTAGKTPVYVDGGNVLQTMVLDMGTLTAQ